jgi:KDO II ethanolaminephosphotransferase
LQCKGGVQFYNSVNADNYIHREIFYTREENVGKRIDYLLLVRELEESIASHQQGKHTVVLNSKRSHHLYTHRYPRSYAWYTPECSSGDVPFDRDQSLNSYDNSIAYTDRFLSQVFGKLENRKAVVFDTSDHG